MQKLLASPDLLLKTVDEQVLVHDRRAGKVHILNGSAGRVLELCDGTRDIEVLSADFARGQSVDAEIARADVLAILTEFERLGLVSSS